MASIFGRTGISVEKGLSPAYDLLASRSGYEIRWYQPYLVAEVGMTEANNAFSVLAKYIGVFGTPANAAVSGSAEAIAMTAPVIQTPVEPKPESISMTAPVVTEAESGDRGDAAGRKMAFIMPTKYGTDISKLPRPTDSRITLRKVDGRGVFVRTYSGWTDLKKEQTQLGHLLADMEKDGLVKPPQAPADAKATLEGGWSWCGSQYHPPFTLPFLRKNEIWLTCPLPEAELRRIAEQK